MADTHRGGGGRGMLLALSLAAGFLASGAPTTLAAACDAFIALAAPASWRYQAAHRVYPVPAPLRRLAVRHMPRLWVHPASWQPIDFADYLAQARLVSLATGAVVSAHPRPADFEGLTLEAQCGLYLRAGEVRPRRPAPVYIQVYRDGSPARAAARWIYVKYNFVFDWSGLARRTSLLTHAGVMLTGASHRRWHRLDVHVAAVLAFDEQHRLRLLTLAQHNYQRTYLAGRDFDPERPLHLAAAFQSNELYLDEGAATPVAYRVVPFFDGIGYLVDGRRRPWLWAEDRVYGRNAGAREVPLRPVFIAPGDPLAAFAGYLAPPKRLLGFYIGRDGPPGFDYYALPEVTPLRNFVALGYWREGDHRLLDEITPLLGDWRETDWAAIVAIMRERLARALAGQG